MDSEKTILYASCLMLDIAKADNKITNDEINIIKETYSNRILIIDEVHNIRGEDVSKKESRNTIKYITLFFLFFPLYSQIDYNSDIQPIDFTEPVR